MRATAGARFVAMVGAAWGAVSSVSCTALGPMPATTGVSAVPAGRPGGEIGFGIVPGYYLSSATQPSPGGAGLSQLSLLLQPDRFLRLPGLSIGARHIGDSKNGSYLEPLIAYRTHLDQDRRFAAAAVGYLTHASGRRDSASYSATRGGVEVGFDVRATPKSRWIELHVNASAALTGLSASGTYCLDAVSRYGVTCPNPPTNVAEVNGGGLYPSASAGVSVDFARQLAVFFHGGRLAFGASGGTMPTVIGGQQEDPYWYGSLGATLTLGFGASRLQ